MTLDDIIPDLCAAMGLKTRIGQNALRMVLSDVQLLDRKQQDYGPGNISAFGELGIVVRCTDKIERLKTLHRTGATAVKTETLEDTWIDLGNYSLIARLIRAGLWT